MRGTRELVARLSAEGTTSGKVGRKQEIPARVEATSASPALLRAREGEILPQLTSVNQLLGAVLRMALQVASCQHGGS
eukprot:CAMPEP_0205917102 /NCGR_PEP_ID=MMETSP1325-20131115/8943_1 /ASSEMBLY_ACC=CAM_ASM_000708 /TAXON_ID=236786 /ORGANISM="Florenciella sp., Strain RCC1007" /LENGTH=77 /DNA_ID=CAMNT_0053284475 /DNA_START=18 /DNA_END=251 /DNA_ORIENTATION=-